MTEQEKNYFDELRAKKLQDIKTFEDPAYSGSWEGIVEKYSEQAHFIYELLQNADDAGATSVHFVLENDRLIFTHNGTRHFSISDPKTEGIDREQGRLGDINAILGIAFSNKENKIGKFGMGFKAVFQYTKTPFVYDPHFRFRIDRYIVPDILANDLPERKESDTVFVFPFNHNDKTPEETYKDIKIRLTNLNSPILFLTNLKEISYEYEDITGSYSKEISESLIVGDTKIERIFMCGEISLQQTVQSLWLFSRQYNGFGYSVGFETDENGKLKPVSKPAYCYFPTKVNTSLHFIIHAPFLLTDSREGIKAGESHNETLINLLASLAGDSLLLLRELGEKNKIRLISDDIINIIPYDDTLFADDNDRGMSHISFKPFYTHIMRIFQTKQIIPTETGYTTMLNAYLAENPALPKLFSDDQLGELCGNPNAHWAFPSIGRDSISRSNKPLMKYLDLITSNWLNEEYLIRGRYAQNSTVRKTMEGITKKFIKKQNVFWLHRLYKWMSETAARTDMAKTAPIFLDSYSEPSAAYDSKGEHILFLPSAMSGYATIREDLLTEKNTVQFINKLGIAQPSLKDEIYQQIIPLYKNFRQVNNERHFALFFQYYKTLSSVAQQRFISEIKDYSFIECRYQEQINSRGFAKGGDLYYPEKNLKRYLETKQSALFVDQDKYLMMFGEKQKPELLDFLTRLGVNYLPGIKERRLDFLTEMRKNRTLPTDRSTGEQKYIERYIDGLEEIVKYIVAQKSKDKSILLWQMLLKISEKNFNLDYAISGQYYYFYRTKHVKPFDSNDKIILRSARWLLNNSGKFCSAKELYLDILSSDYETKSYEARRLLDFLDIKEKPVEQVSRAGIDDSNLTDEQRNAVKIGRYAAENGISLSDLMDLKMDRERKRKLAQEQEYQELYNTEEATQTPLKQKPTDSSQAPDNDDNTSRISKRLRHISNDICQIAAGIPDNEMIEPYSDLEENADSDEYMPRVVDFSKRIKYTKDKAANKVIEINKQEELLNTALSSRRYTYKWFLSLLQAEIYESNTQTTNSKEVSISFANVEFDPGTRRTLILRKPNKPIPQYIEDLTDIPLTLDYGGETKSLAIEVASVKGFTLRVKLKPHVNVSSVDFSGVRESRIVAQKPTFLLEELRKSLEKLNFKLDYDMQANLCKNIQFVFGAPGTGKTTYLSSNHIIPVMSWSDDYKVLVLTPTNGAADVLTRKIINIMGNDHSFKKWLIRFGVTADEIIEANGVWHDKTFDIRSLKRCVVVTTIDRFPYDFFMPPGQRIFLSEINWDYIIIDEASMIPLVKVIYPLYKKVPRQFIIAGDPFQIEPAIKISQWKNENIYTMVGLNSFTDPKTTPHNYPVKLLTEEYRSVPSIGRLYSRLTYGGSLRHHRQESSPVRLEFGGLKFESLNIIKFPVSKYESIYRPKRLKGSWYHTYSALFTYELVRRLAPKINTAGGNPIKIGIISPYHAQAELIEKLISSCTLPPEISVRASTIHGFQGEECEIIFAVFNPPDRISASKELFINKLNIINVAISRAKDYLFVLMPDDDTENVNNLMLIKEIEHYIRGSSNYFEESSQVLEMKLFGSGTYLEDSTFSTGHQNVNVYGTPEKVYEVRSEDDAVDIQVMHKIGSYPEQRNAAHTQAEPAEEPQRISVPVMSGIPSQPEKKPVVSAEQTDFVYSSKYGEGRIISRENMYGRTIITVKFEKSQKTFDEAVAISRHILSYIQKAASEMLT